METAELIIRIVLAAVFATAGVGKLLDLEGSRGAMRDFGLAERLARPAGLLLPIAELAAAVALIFPGTARWGAVAALILLLAFIGGIANALRHGVAPDCHCFGQIHSAPAGPETLIRNGVLAAMALFVVIAGAGPAVDTWVGDRSAAELVAVAIGAAFAVLALFSYQLWTEVKRLRKDIGAATRMAAAAPPGLPIGTPAPEFALTTMDGGTMTLAELRARGNPILLVFTSPWCGSCAEVFPSLRRWQQTLSQRLTIALISTGEIKDNEPVVAEHGVEMLLLQKDGEVIEDYRIRGTPSAVLINADGRIGALPAESVFAIEPMVRLVLRGGDPGAIPQGSVA